MNGIDSLRYELLTVSRPLQRITDKIIQGMEHENPILDSAKPKSMILAAVVGQYPLTIYGTFGITNSKHGIKMYPLHKSYGRYLLSDLVQKHQLQKKYADHLYKATTNGLDPRRTNLLSGNEAIIDSDHSTPCPLTSGMVHLIQCCPTQS
ncbi:unnamed protein product [Adineta steineri]|uniref:Uncharacterized protein n=1 Tax=Adineta steineri TaxID=433720 RepID=A0A813VTK2_9BILA|nr:unnamed protein product [Adineta steineri]